MPITKEQYRNFYFGAGVELYFASQFYMMGYEAYTTNPDVGYDLSVTNQCRMKYKGEERKNYSIQVKSSILVKDKTSFFVPFEDFEILCNDSESYLICAYYIPECKGDPCSLVEDRAQIYALDRMIDESYMANSYSGFHKFSIDEAESAFTFVDFDIRYLWLNAKQLACLRENNYFYEYIDDRGKTNMRLDVCIGKCEAVDSSITGNKLLTDTILLRKKGKKADLYDIVIPECRSIYYLLSDNYLSKNRIEDGKIMLSEY